jgi:hypothetical protein
MKSMRDDAEVLALDTLRLAWATKRTIPDVVARTVSGRMDTLRKENEAVRRLPRAEQDRIFGDIEREERQARTLAAAVARYAVEPNIAALAERHRAYLSRRRRDVSVSFPSALDHFNPGDMIALELLRETLRPQIDSANIADLTQRYNRAYEHKDARGLIEAELIEARVERGGLAKSEEDRAAVKQLAESIEVMQDMRIVELEAIRNIEDAIEAAHKAVSRAEIAQVRAINPEHDLSAKSAHAAAEAEYAQALAADAAGR